MKVYASRGSFDSVDTTQTLTFDEMKAIVDAAHGLGHKVAIHSYGASGVRDAVRAGADSKDYIEKNLDSARRAVKAGVKLGMGSDAVYSMFGQNTRELEWFVKVDLLGQRGTLGCLAPGCAADIAAVEGHPLEDIHDVVTGVR